jgi:hypothetical protein
MGREPAEETKSKKGVNQNLDIPSPKIPHSLNRDAWIKSLSNILRKNLQTPGLYLMFIFHLEKSSDFTVCSKTKLFRNPFETLLQ